MADTKISALSAAVALSGGEKILAVQSGASVAVTPNQIAAFLGGRSWYVANGGNDANSGLAPTAPFQTLGKVKAVMATGDRVLLRCGSTFRESFDISGFGRVTIESYGAGTRPVIDGADIITETWSPVSGNVYRVVVTIPEGTGANRGYPGIFENGVLLAEFDNGIDALSTGTARIAAVQAKPGSFLLESPSAYGAGWSAGASFSYIVQASDGGNPASNGSLYEVRKRQYTIVHAGALINGITFRRQWFHDGACLLYNSTLPGKWTNCVFDQMARHHTIDSLSDYEDCIATRPNPKYPGSYLFHAYGPAGQANSKRYKRCKAIGDGVTTSAGFGTHSSVGGTPCQAKIVYEECENYGVIGFSGYDFSTADYIRCRNVDCITDVSASPTSFRLIDCDFRGAGGTSAWIPPSAGCKATLIRTKWIAATSQAFALANANVGTIDIQEGCELLWEGLLWNGPSAFFCFNGSYTGTSLKMRRSIVGAIGGAKRVFEYSGSSGFAARDIDADTMIGGFLATRTGTQNTMAAVLEAQLSGTLATLIGTAGVATLQAAASLRRLYAGDPVRDGPAKRPGANWPIFAGFNAAAYPPSGGSTQISVGRTIVVANTGYKVSTPAAYVPASELFDIVYISASTALACGANGLILRSVNSGAAWTTIASGTTNTLRAIAFNGTTVVIVGDGGTITRSTDGGATFTLLATPGGTTDLYSVTYGASLFVACGASSYTTRSADGSDGSWTWQQVQGSSNNWRGVAFGGSTFAMVGGTLVSTSTNGVSWTTQASRTLNDLRSVATDGTVFAAVANQQGPLGSELMVSIDAGVTWIGQPLDPAFDLAFIRPPAVETNRWVAGGRSTHQLFAYDPRGQWRSEAMTPIDGAALRLTRSGADGFLAAA